MKTRILAGVVGIPVTLAVILFTPVWGFGIAVSVVSAIAAYELLRCVLPERGGAMTILSIVAAAAIPLGEGVGVNVVIPVALILFFGLNILIIRSYKNEKKMSFVALAMGMIAGVMIPTAFMTLLWLRKSGTYLALLPIIIAFATDSGAYFVGMTIGKHKLAPHLSPKKTIEGSVGGTVVGTLITMLYGYVLSSNGLQVNYVQLAVCAFVGSVFCQLGDLSFSAIKREYGIKDYGNLIPGHGGILDRFDSMVFTAPSVALTFTFYYELTSSSFWN